MRKQPWIWIILGWGALLTATFLTVRLCLKHAPKEVPLETPKTSASHGA